MKKLMWVVLWGALVVPSASWAGPGILGDDSPYPLACMNFTGQWKSDSDEFLDIRQGDCKWLTIRTKIGPRDHATTIVPDDKAREISGSQWTGHVRHRWNSKVNGTIIETHKELVYADKMVEELVLLEKVNPKLLLESTYRTIRVDAGGKEVSPPQQEYEQRVFRLQTMNGGGGGW